MKLPSDLISSEPWWKVPVEAFPLSLDVSEPLKADLICRGVDPKAIRDLLWKTFRCKCEVMGTILLEHRSNLK